MRIAILAALCLIATSCRTGRNYPDPEGPRYGGAPLDTLFRAVSDTVRFVSFNVEFARQIDSAIAVLTLEPALRDADVILLQEMDSDGTRRIAEALRTWYVYYPAVYHTRADRQFGNAVLSRWPIVEDAKIILPHVSRYAATQRIATAATVRVGTVLLRVYSTHLGTPADISPSARRNQLRTIAQDAERYERAVVGGDMNSGSAGRVMRELGYMWPTETGPHTASLGRWDHIFFKGLVILDSASAGTIMRVRNTSDHRPVWAIGVIAH